MARRSTPRVRQNMDGEHTIPRAPRPGILRHLVFNDFPLRARHVRQYVEVQARPERVTHLELMRAETVLSQRMDAWDVHTTRTRYWVITNPTNLYSQRDFPSLDYTITFHVGLAMRVHARQARKVGPTPQGPLAPAWRKWQQAAVHYDAATEVEDFQGVGVRCRECLQALVRGLASPHIVPSGEAAPKRGDVVNWCTLIAAALAPSDSGEYVRRYLRESARITWQMANWLAHATGATEPDARLTLQATDSVLTAFTVAGGRGASDAPVQCPQCGSLRLVRDYRPRTASEVTVCESCGWEHREVTPRGGDGVHAEREHPPRD